MATVSSAVNQVETPTAPGVPATLPAEPPARAEHRFMIRGVDWGTYRKISEALTDRHFHMSFDGEDLELMSTYREHDQCSRLINDFVVVLTDETGLPRASCGGMTLDREDLEQGIEADESYYFANASKVRGKKRIDLSVDPPPDLGVEIDLTTDSRRRLGIYARIAVPEIWRYDGQTITIYQRQSDGQYAVAECSRYFPFVSGADLQRFLAQRGQADETALLQSFRHWVREQLGKRSKTPREH